MKEKTLGLVESIRNKEKKKVLFVCLGNICRSPAAEGVFKAFVEEAGLEDEFEVDSCGFYGGHAGDLPDKRMRVHAQRRGYTLDHRSRVIRPSDFEDFDILIGMDDNNISSLRRAARTAEDLDKIVGMAEFIRHHGHTGCVPDPYYEGSEGFELVLDLLEDGCLELMNLLKREEN